MKKALCIVLASIILLSLSGCSDLFGTVFLSTLVAIGDDRAEKEDIFSFVTEHEEELLQAIKQNDFSDFKNNGIIHGVYASGTAVEFSCGGAGMGSNTTYVGFFYSPSDDMTAVWCAPSSKDLLMPSGDGFVWEEDVGDNRFYTEKICDCFYYYEASY